MPQKRILPYVILGILEKGDATGKQITDEFKYEIGEFWKSSHSQIYPELKHMLTDGWIDSYQKEDNDKEIYYRPTNLGKEIIADWLATPVVKLPVSKDLFSLKVFFINRADDPRLKTLIANQKKLVSQNLAHLKKRKAELFDTAEKINHNYGHYLILQRAISRQENQLAWLDQLTVC